jgi:hypothetical protein
MTRRIFLKTTGALIAYFTAQNVLGGIVAKAEAINYIENLRKAVDSGYVYNQIFVLTNPIDFGELNIKFEGCSFIFKDFTHEYAMRTNGTVQIYNCEINAREANAKTVLFIDKSCNGSSIVNCSFNSSISRHDGNCMYFVGDDEYECKF